MTIEVAQPCPQAAGRQGAPLPHRVRRKDADWVVHTRWSDVGRERVWAAMTAPAELSVWAGIPKRVGADTIRISCPDDPGNLPLSYRLDRWSPPEALWVTIVDGSPAARHEWRLEVSLAEQDGGTLLTLAQEIQVPALAAWVATGCSYRLDQLVDHLSGRPPRTTDQDVYFLAHAEHYRRLFALPS